MSRSGVLGQYPCTRYKYNDHQYSTTTSRMSTSLLMNSVHVSSSGNTHGRRVPTEHLQTDLRTRLGIAAADPEWVPSQLHRKWSPDPIHQGGDPKPWAARPGGTAQ